MSLKDNFGMAATRLQENAPGLEAGLTPVFHLNAANVPASDVPGARLGLVTLLDSQSVGRCGNADFSSRLMQGIQLADLEQSGPALAPTRGLTH